MSLIDIRGLTPSPSWSSRDDNSSDVSMRTVGQERLIAEDWKSLFLPAIRTQAVSAEFVRYTEWYVVQFSTSKEKVLRRVLDHVGMNYRYFTYEFKRPRKKPTIRAWLPGYMMVEFDIEVDRWQQLLDMPGVIEILGRPSPLPNAGKWSIDELSAKLAYKLPKNTGVTSVGAGEQIKITEGFGAGFTGTVLKSDRKYATVMMVMFGALQEVDVSLRHIKIL